MIFLDEEENLDQEIDPSAEQSNNIPDADPALGSTNFNTTLNPKKAIAKKAAIAILTSPIFWIVLGVTLFILFFVLTIVNIDFDFFGVGHVEPKERFYSCSNVYLTWEREEYIKEHEKIGDYEPITDPNLVDLEDDERFDYDTYDFDTYITGIVWNDNHSFHDVDNDVVYQAMSITARTYLVATLADNCVVLRDYNPQNFKKLSGQEHKYSEIKNSVTSNSGVVMGRDGQFFEAEYDAFSYTDKYREDEDDYKKKGSYYMMNMNETGYQTVPSDWVTQYNIPMTKVSSNTKLKSLSVYGAKHLLEKVYSQYGVHRVLEYYFGRNIDYYTINYTNENSNGCMWWPIGSDETTNENGKTFAKGTPASVRITSNFGIRNKPTAGASSNHKAIDIGGPTSGYPEGVINIIAAANGTVTRINLGCVSGNSSCGGGLGNYVLIQHEDGTVTRYGHMYSVSVHVDEKVSQGQVIGKMGNTGTSSGTHLDFQVQVNGKPVDPLNYVSTSNPRPENCGSYTPGPITGTFNGKGKEEFIKFIAPYAVADMHSSNILASVTIAQAALESGWGKSDLSSKYNNFFGMKKGSSWNGPTVTLMTTECDKNGNCHKEPAVWRVYPNPLDSLKDHSRLLQASRYQGVVGEKNYEKALTIIKNGGYATDPNYVDKLVKLIQNNNLAYYDTM